MIRVPFLVEKGQDFRAHLEECRPRMPWLDYLCTHATKLEINSWFDQPTFYWNVDYTFHLPPELETYYYLAYR